MSTKDLVKDLILRFLWSCAIGSWSVLAALYFLR